MSSGGETGMSPSPTSLEKATELLICLPTTNTCSTLVFMLIVPKINRVIRSDHVSTCFPRTIGCLHPFFYQKKQYKQSNYRSKKLPTLSIVYIY
ncbi:hypothetical protein LINPERPRIM_LOCUS34198 [Linum perenne]